MYNNILQQISETQVMFGKTDAQMGGEPNLLSPCAFLKEMIIVLLMHMTAWAASKEKQKSLYG